MTIPDWILHLLPVAVIAVSGLFAFVKWLDQRNRELTERRFEQYWKLVENSQTGFLAKQKVALLLLKRYPEYR